MRFVKMLIVSGAFLGMPLASTASDCPHSEPRDATLDAGRRPGSFLPGMVLDGR